MKILVRLLMLMLTVCMLAGCSAAPEKTQEEKAEEIVEMMDAPVPLADTPETANGELGTITAPEAPAALPTALEPVASGVKEKRNGRAVIDHSHAEDGYIMVSFTAKTSKRLKVRVTGPATTYTYDLTPGIWEVFPLSDGNGSYKVSVFQNIAGTKYSTELSGSFGVELKDEFGPYLYPNQYVNYSVAPEATAKAAELTAGLEAPLEKVAVIYDYVVTNLTYDFEKAATVKSGYLPVLDSVLAEKKGICFDYASLMTGMLRSQGVPCKLVVGYAGGAYHAWISVWSEETGWIDGAIFFDGVAWQRMDPTFASTGNQSESTMAYIGNGSNYTAKYLY